MNANNGQSRSCVLGSMLIIIATGCEGAGPQDDVRAAHVPLGDPPPPYVYSDVDQATPFDHFGWWGDTTFSVPTTYDKWRLKGGMFAVWADTPGYNPGDYVALFNHPRAHMWMIGQLLWGSPHLPAYRNVDDFTNRLFPLLGMAP